MDFYSCTDKATGEEIGHRIRSLRLSMNITQKALAQATTLSLNAIKSLESGKGKLSTLIAVMRELKVLDQLDILLPEDTISPLQLARMQGKQRQRASGERVKDTSKHTSEW